VFFSWRFRIIAACNFRRPRGYCSHELGHRGLRRVLHPQSVLGLESLDRQFAAQKLSAPKFAVYARGPPVLQWQLLADRIKSSLHSNCATCLSPEAHRRGALPIFWQSDHLQRHNSEHGNQFPLKQRTDLVCRPRHHCVDPLNRKSASYRKGNSCEAVRQTAGINFNILARHG